jgi:predicted transcriptional regulator
MLRCESAAKYKVPAIKAKLARELKEKGLSQKEIASLLDVTEAAISQYLSGKRARSKRKIATEKSKTIPEVCRMCGMCQFK